MDKELKAKWVAALRSGEYKQGRNWLVRHDGSMCCLGVLRHVANPEDREDSSSDGPDFSPNQMLSSAQVGRFGLVVQPRTLAIMNDDEGKSFAEIADYIEANL